MGPLSFQLHPLTIAATCLAILVYPLICAVDDQSVKHPSMRDRFVHGIRQSSAKQKRLFLLGMLALFIANYWPLADIAQHYLLLARMLQQLLVTLAAAPMLLYSIPRSSIVVLTRPRLLDAVLTRLTRPVPAILIFSATTILAMTPSLVTFEMSSVWAQQLVHAWLLVAAVLAWTPIMRMLPGVRQLSTAGRLAYLLVLSLLPNIPAIVLIFAKRPLYLGYAHSGLGIGLIVDQELTGAIAKVVSLAVFWGVAISILLRADRDEELGLDPDPITWDDVQRELDRNAKRFPQG